MVETCKAKSNWNGFPPNFANELENECNHWEVFEGKNCKYIVGILSFV